MYPFLTQIEHVHRLMGYLGTAYFSVTSNCTAPQWQDASCVVRSLVSSTKRTANSIGRGARRVVILRRCVLSKRYILFSAGKGMFVFKTKERENTLNTFAIEILNIRPTSLLLPSPRIVEPKYSANLTREFKLKKATTGTVIVSTS